MLVEEAATKGVPGLAAYLALWAFTALAAVRAARRAGPRDRALLVCAGGALAGWFVQSQTLFPTAGTWLEHMLLLAYLARLGADGREAAPERPRPAWWPAPGAGARTVGRAAAVAAAVALTGASAASSRAAHEGAAALYRAETTGGLAFAAPRQGVALDLKGRGLIAHEASGFREWGASASLTWDPRPTTDRGLALRLRQSWGGSPTGGMDALLGRETLAGLAADDNGGTASAGRLEAELGYGIPAFDGAVTATPHLGLGLSDTSRDYRLGWRLNSARKGDPGFTIGLDATRREALGADAEHGLMLRGTVHW